MRKIITAFMMLLCAVCMASAANYLTFTAEEDSSTFGIMNEKNNPDVQYTLDGGETWTALAAGDTITLAHKGDKALLRGNNPEGFSKGYSYSSFTLTGKVAASGSVMSLVDGLGVTTAIPNEGCFYYLFFDCSALTQAPELPATTLAERCYEGMFSGCTSLTQAPALPATILAEVCYREMFRGCTSLTQAPELPATTLAEACYIGMFLGCTSLSEIKVSFDDWNRGHYTGEWVIDVAPTGTFICPKALALEYGVDRIPEGWTVKYIDDTVAVETNYLTFTAEEDGSSFGIVNNGSNNPDVQYSLDGGATWIALAEGDTVILAHKGDKALLRGNNPEGFSKSWEQYSTFKMTGKVAASGSVMSLIDGVGLSTEISKSFCFYRLFSGCTSLTQAPELPAKTLAYYCYNSMFEGCTSLTQAPELPATEMTFYCYNRMFSGCTSLTQAPELPATTLFDNCYSGMFSGCTSLTRAPELPAIKMFSYCYSGMFSGCTSLTQAPELPAKEFLGKYSYSGMFSGCTSLSEINVSFDDWDKFDATFEWVADVAPTGTFICPKDLPLEYGVSRIPEGWTVQYVDDTVAVETNYLTFTAEEDGSTFGIINEGGNNPDVQYSLDGGKTWTALAAGDTITLAHKGDKALLRGDNPEGFSKSREQYSTFRMTGKVSASGSVMSLIDGIGKTLVVPAGDCFHSLFEGCTSLTQAPELPATTLAEGCYQYMFFGCTSLTEAPELPATTLAEYCYLGMFRGCTSLTQAPELPATTMYFGCYNSMFRGCTSLTEAPELPATTLASCCYYYMFEGCTSLIRAPQISALTMDFRDCIAAMFSGCTNLSEISVAFEEWSSYIAYTREWVANVAPTGIFICPKALPLEYGVDRIPEGWTVKYIDDTVAVETNYLTFTAEEDGSTFGIVNNGGNNPDVQYSLDGGETWNILAEGDSVILVHKGEKALLRGNNPEGFSKYLDQYSCFRMTGKLAASGSIMSLIDGVGISTEVPGNFCFYKLFEGCTSLTQAPELPATTLAYSCYRNMFEGCTSLTQAPKLPATTLAEACYFGMFAGCTSLTQAPELPATTLPTTSNVENGCYSYMFEFCISLTQAPELPATTLAEGCYTGMFYACTSLTQAPKLPATTLADFCYFEMFSGCTSLTQAPELPATTLTDFCYDSMFKGCASLTQAPELPAKEFLGKYSYSRMFFGCTSLSKINVSFATWSDYYSNTDGWVKDVAPTGTFICPKTLALEYGISRIPEGWTVKYIEDMANYLTFTAEEDSSSFGIVNNGSNNPDVQYSLDGGETWNILAEGDTVILAHKGDKALLRGNNPEGFSKSWEQYSTFKMTGKVAASGSVMSLIDGVGISTEVPGDYRFYKLFQGCTSLTQAPELPATTLAVGCYYEMFSGCTSLTQAPKLPATTLASGCYYKMFSGCTSLTQAPALPATTLAKYCYNEMFRGCTSLTQAPALPATTLAEDCYGSMFSECTGLTQAPELPATTLADDCYMGMFASCTSLTQAPELPVTELAERCYDKMFWGCTGLTEAPELPATTLRYYCYHGMFIGCTGLTRAPELPATTMAEYCYGSMFYRCSGLKQAPELPATTLATSCYNSMFDSCISLTQAPELPATTLADDCYDKMFKGCTGLTHAPELPAAKLTSDCYSSMFSGCTNLSEISAAFLWWRNTSDWVADVAPTGTFYCSKELPLEYGVSAIPEGWTVKYPDGSTVEYVDVSTTLADNISVWSDDLTVYVCGAEGEVSLYDLSGKRVAVSVSADEERALSVPAKGVYVVRTNNGTSDVLVR
jgi:hypothetical protein